MELWEADATYAQGGRKAQAPAGASTSALGTPQKDRHNAWTLM